MNGQDNLSSLNSNTEAITTEEKTNDFVEQTAGSTTASKKKKKDKKNVEKVYHDDEDVREKNIVKDLLPYVIILVAVILVRTFVITPVKVNGASMQPTLEDQQTLILNKISKYERFDIVVINSADEHLIKRIIALPGETIEYKNNKLYIDEEEVADNYGDGDTADFGPIKLEDGQYFVLGDNRMHSHDSRQLGGIDKKYILGTTTFRLFPLKEAGSIAK